MRETILAGYFDGQVSSETLLNELVKLRGTNVLEKDVNLFCDLSYYREINLDDLGRIGGDYLRGILDASDVEAVSLFLMGSDHFEWDKQTQDGAIVADIIGDWSSPETAYPINKKNMKMIVRGLGEGVYDIHQLESNNSDSA